jgi:Leucine-rich repeat (LRR) protein
MKSTLTPALTNLPKLRDLCLSRNEITEIEENMFSRCTNLSKIDLKLNKVTVFKPNAFKNVPNSKL